MADESGTLRVGLAQVDSRLGDVDGNLERHLSRIEEARAAGVDLLVFPELSLTGYRLLHLTSRVALHPRRSPQLERLAQATIGGVGGVGGGSGMTIVAGFVEESDLGSLHNSAAVFQDGAIVHVHRKIYLPTYGLFQEERFLGRGRRLGLVPLAGSPVGVLICEDLWHPELARRLALGGARLLVVPSAGPGRVGPGPVPESSESWEVVTRAAALYNTCWVVYCNRVGWEEGSFYAGGSHVVRPGGEILARAPFVDEHLLVADIDLRDADRLRWRLPLLEDERTDVEGPA